MSDCLTTEEKLGLPFNIDKYKHKEITVEIDKRD